MFTSRAEYRTLLRQDNADLRLTELSYRLGLASQERMDRVREKQSMVEQIIKNLNTFSVEPEEINHYLESMEGSLLTQKQKAVQVLLRPTVSLSAMLQSVPRLAEAILEKENEILEQAEIQIKYQTYIEKEKELVERVSQLEELLIPESFDYKKLHALSAEARQKFATIKPRTLGQASRISGVTPSDIQILMVYMRR
jgi:tRNA uridine 5-carboxymethylaminomethyl modification enzyme